MNELPDEIQIKIFTQLSLGQRLDCTLVCRKWWSVLDKYCLLYDVEIDGSTTCFSAFMDMINRSPHRAGQVEELRLNECVDPGFNKRTLCDLFYNARLIEVTYDDPFLEDFDPFVESVEVTHARPKLESVTDSIYCELVSQILTANLGGHLHTLVLRFFSLDEFDTKGVLPKIQNLPVLKSLTLAVLDIRIDELERIHQNVPSIQDLTLQDIEVLDSYLPSSITPASVTSFYISIFLVDNIEAHIRWYQYMKSKYINVTSTRYDDNGLDGYDRDQTILLYSNGILGFLQLIGHSSNTIHLTNIPPNVNIFRELDDAHAQINEFDLFKSDNPTLLYDLSCSNQSNHAEILRFTDMQINSIHLLQNMPKLTVIELNGVDEINLTEYLSAIPDTVTEFSVECDCVLIDPAYTRKISIEMLFVDCHKLNPELGPLISECFPYLVTLKLKCPVQNDMHIMSHQNQPLQKAIFGIYNSEISGFVFNNVGETEYYLYDSKTTCVERPVLEGLPCLTFTTHRSFELDADGDTIVAFRVGEEV